jgi:hypothetical protein
MEAGSCLLCDSGFACKDGFKLGCMPGQFSLAGSGQCSSCLAGTFQGDKDQGKCNICEKGAKCPVGTTSSINCGNGKYAPWGSSQCPVCPAGSSCVDGIQRLCPDGSFASFGQASCLECPKGT